MNLIAQLEAEQIASLGKTIPDFKAGDTIRVRCQFADLPVHDQQRLPSDLRIIRDAAVCPTRTRVPEFKIRHININKSIQQFQRVRVVIASGIVYQGDMQSLGDRHFQRRQNLGHNVRCGYQVDIVATHVLKLQHYGCQLRMRYGLAGTLMTDVEVLTKETTDVAMGEENRSSA